MLGLEIGPSEHGAFWTAFVRGLGSQRFGGVQLEISDAHQGLTGAIVAALGGASPQCCRVHGVSSAPRSLRRPGQPRGW